MWASWGWRQRAWDLIPVGVLLTACGAYATGYCAPIEKPISMPAMAVIGTPMLGALLVPWVVTWLTVRWEHKHRHERARWEEQARRDLESERSRRKLERRRERKREKRRHKGSLFTRGRE